MRKLLTAVLVVVGMNLPPVIATPKMFSIAHVGTTDTGGSTGSCAGTISTAGASHTAGNLLVAHAWHGGAAAALTIASTNNTWHSTGQGFSVREAAYAYNVNSGSDTVTATWTGTRTGCGITVDEFSGFSTSDPFEHNGVSSSGTGSPITTSTVTVTNPAVISAGFSNSSSITGSSSTTCASAVGASAIFFSGCYKIVSANDAATATSGGSTAWTGEGASYTAAGGGTTFPAAIINGMPLKGGGVVRR